MSATNAVIAHLRGLLERESLEAADRATVRRELAAAERSLDAARGVILMPQGPT
jgi:hypothetical protein